VDTQGLSAVFEADESGPSCEVGTPDSVVANRQAQAGFLDLSTDGHLRGVSVLGGVGQRFSHHVVDGGFNGVG
jgi:hypothetical protein